MDLEHFRNGGFLIVTDDQDRENEADLFLAAEHATPEKVAFMVTHTTGIICVALPDERLQVLGLEPFAETSDKHGTGWRMPVDAKSCVGSGVSATDRALTIRTLVSGDRDDFYRPGHVFPLAGHPDGLQARRGHTEAALLLADRAGVTGVALAELVHEGEMLRGDSLKEFAKTYGIPVYSIASLAGHPSRM